MTDENIIESNVESAKKSKKVLVLFAHPAQTRSEVNVPLFHEAKMNKHVTAVDLYAEYPDFNIDIEREQQRLIDHEVSPGSDSASEISRAAPLSPASAL